MLQEACICLPYVEGPECEHCKPLYWNLDPENPTGCAGASHVTLAHVLIPFNAIWYDLKNRNQIEFHSSPFDSNHLDGIKFHSVLIRIEILFYSILKKVKWNYINYDIIFESEELYIWPDSDHLKWIPFHFYLPWLEEILFH